nr:MAG TPA: hypothetical protein [Caudoviricetes sp.]
MSTPFAIVEFTFVKPLFIPVTSSFVSKFKYPSTAK